MRTRGSQRMSSHNQIVEAAALSEASRVVEPIREALTKARTALYVAADDVRRLDAECIKEWTKAYRTALKAAEAADADADADATR